ncbi:peptide-methionine (R)-S-oxide reductase MsrB, partial [Candidatus Kaiserbacteria bacterium]|nr:peptide-methionine (R)-S-oxide reductase MsrB [Candidatus Kaiserbacteria bacterium]
MDFFSSLFLSIATFFGLVQAEPEVTSVAAESEIIMEDNTKTALEETNIDTTTNETYMKDDHKETLDSEEENISEMKETENLETETKVVSKIASNPEVRTMIVAGGCFWCVEADLEKINGVIEVVSGYSGGTTKNPTYEDYGKGGHREVVEVTYDANQVSFEDILIVAMKTTDPTDDDGTFHDRGDKYSPAFYYENEEQRQIIENLIKEVNQYGPYDKPLAIDVEERATFWPAEEYHQDYYKGTLSQLKYKYYRNASGRDDLILKYWGVNDHSSELPWRNQEVSNVNEGEYMWSNYKKPSDEILKNQLDDLAYKVTQDEGTERSGTSPLDKNWEAGIYVDVLSGEPLYSSKDKFDSGTGWPSFVRPITPGAVTEHEDKKLFTTRTEIRSAIADNHLGHVFDDGPKEQTGLRYCMNGAALRFIPKDQMEAEGYGDFIK